MDDEVKQLIKERMAQLPQEVRDAIKRTDFAEKFNAIAERHNLNLDQNGTLQTKTLLLMLALEPSDEFVGGLERELEVSHKEAVALADDVNNTILFNIRDTIRKIEEEQAEADARAGAKEWINQVLSPNQVMTSTPSSPIPTKTVQPEPVAIPTPEPIKPPVAPIEKVGDFTVTTRPPSSSPLYNDSNLNKEDVLADLENIKNLKPENAENFVEHLISAAAPVEPAPAPAPAPAPTPVQPPPPQPVTPPSPPTPPPVPKPEPKKYESDPYREPI